MKLFLLTALFCFASIANADPVRQAVAAACDSKLVVIGELPSHGEREIFTAKAEIARQLIERCGFDALVFESGVYDFVGLQRAVAAGKGQQLQLDQAIGGFWTNAELSEWREWLLQQSNAGKLQLAGLDDQVSASANYARAVLPGLVAQAADQACASLVDRHLHWRYGPDAPFDDAAQRALGGCAARIEAALGDVAVQKDRWMLANLARYLQRDGGRAGYQQRQSSMADNLHWLLDHWAPNTRVIVWTASVHASNATSSDADATPGPLLHHPGRERFSIALTALAGRSGMAGSPARVLPDLPFDSLEAQALSSGDASAWLLSDDLVRMGPSDSRLLGRVQTGDWAKHFDGVVVLREVSPPTWPPR